MNDLWMFLLVFAVICCYFVLKINNLNEEKI